MLAMASLALDEFKIDCISSIVMAKGDSLLGYAVLEDGTGLWCESKALSGQVGTLTVKSRERPVFVCGCILSKSGEPLAAGMSPLAQGRGKLKLKAPANLTITLGPGQSGDTIFLVPLPLYEKGIVATPWLRSFQNGLAKIRLQRGEALDVLVGESSKSGGEAGQPSWVRLVPDSLVKEGLLKCPWVKQAKRGNCRFESLPVPGKHWIFVHNAKRRLIDFNRYLKVKVDLR